MTAPEIIANLRTLGVPQSPHLFRYLAEHAPEARLRDGAPLLTVVDTVAWLIELREAAWTPMAAASKNGKSPLDTCSRCGHIHKDVECGEWMGAERFCRCARGAA